ncbi:MAG: TRAP transporter small permease [Pseudomonadota bacterium]
MDAVAAEPLPRALRLIETVLDGLSRLCLLLTGIALVVLTVIFGWLVFGRYVLNATPTWVEQAAFLLVMMIAFLGAAIGVRENTHLSVSLFRDALPRKAQLVVLGVTDLLMGLFGALMFWFGGQLTLFKWGSLIPLIQVPEGLRSLPLTVGGGLILLFSLGHLVRLVTGTDRRATPAA